jgi:hypothetical protein
MQELVQKMTDKCFSKCTGKSGNRLDSKVNFGWGDVGKSARQRFRSFLEEHCCSFARSLSAVLNPLF